MEPVLVIGVGNEVRGDEALGPVVARELRARDIPETVILETGGDGTTLIEMWKRYARVIIVDTFSSGSTSGLIHSLDASITSVHHGMFRGSSHSFGPAEAVELARRLGTLPKTLLICGIEGHSFRPGSGLSAPVRSRLPEFLDDLEEKICELIHERDRLPSA